MLSSLSVRAIRHSSQQYSVYSISGFDTGQLRQRCDRWLNPAIQGRFEFIATDFDCTQRMQVPGWQLAIDHFVVTRINQVFEAELGGIGRTAEHGFTEKYFAESDTVKPTYEFILVTTFYRMRKSGTVHLDIGIDHLRVDPGAALTFAVSGAGFDYGLEILVQGYLVTLLTSQFLQAYFDKSVWDKAPCAGLDTTTESVHFH